MPVLDAEEVEVVTGAGAPEPESDDFKISEAISLGGRSVDDAVTLIESYIEDDARRERLMEAVREEKAIVLDLIRPCIGRGRGKHLYKPEMLEANAGKFNGWKMYLNHLSDAARRALGGLPRDVRDLGGIVQESWWNPDVPAEGRYGKGAVQGVVTPVPLIQELHKVDPRLVECSINATATSCKPGKVGTERVWIVEGIEEKGSVDWVTEAGAGGRVASIMEALIEDEAVTGVLDTLDNGTILAWVHEHRPDLAEALSKPKSKGKGDGDAEDEEDGGDDEEAEMVAELLKSGKAKTRAQAVALAKRALATKSKGVTESGTEGDQVPDLDAAVLTEAFGSDEGKTALREAIGPVVVEVVRGLDLGSEVVKLVEAKLTESTEEIRVDAEARAERRNELRDLRDAAHRKIEESKLSPLLKKQSKAKFDLIEGTPTDALDLVADEDEKGAVVKSAQVKIEEAVAEEIREGLSIMAEINPTRVRGQGASTLTEGANGDKKDKDEEGDKPDTVGPTTRALLEATGIPGDKVEEVYARSL